MRSILPLDCSLLFGDPTLQQMDAEQKGSHLLLLIAAWQDGGTLPNDDTKLAAIVGVTLFRWQQIRKIVLAPWRLGNDGRLRVEWLTAAYEHTQAISAARSKAARSKRNRKPTASVPTRRHPDVVQSLPGSADGNVAVTYAFPPLPEPTIPTLAEVREYAGTQFCGFNLERVEEWYKYQAANKWQYAHCWQARMLADRYKPCWRRPSEPGVKPA